MAQLVKQFGPILHLFVGKFDAQCPYCIRCSGIGYTRKAKVNEVGADGFFFTRLAKKTTENKAELRGVLLLHTAVYKLVVLGLTFYEVSNEDYWEWNKGPMPWEGGNC